MKLQRARLMVVWLTVSLFGCSFLNPYSNEPSYRQGERPSYTALALTNTDSPGCKGESAGCEYTGKILLNQPTQNMSFQLYRLEANGKTSVVTCASPAEAAKALGTTGELNVALPAAAATSAPAYSLGGKSSTTEQVQAIQSTDAASHFVAIAAFESCLAYASGAMDGKTFTQQLAKIYDNATSLGRDVTAPPPAAKASAPAAAASQPK